MSEGKVTFTEALITDEMLAEVRKFIGTKFRIGHSINNEEATRIAIQKFADGIGDTNPLWTDPEYAAKTRYGAIVAPPSWVFSVFSGIQNMQVKRAMAQSSPHPHGSSASSPVSSMVSEGSADSTVEAPLSSICPY